MAQARPFAGLETGVAEVPRLGPGRQPIARAGGDQLPGERGPGRQPWPGAGPPRSGWGDPRAVGPDPVVIVPGVQILLFSIFLRSRLLRRAPALDPPARGLDPPVRRRGDGGLPGPFPIRFTAGQVDQATGGILPGRFPTDVPEVLQAASVTAGRSPGGDGPGRRSSYRRASSWRRPGRSRRGPPAPANRSARAWGRRRCRGGWRRRGYSSCIGSPGRTLPPSDPRGRGRCGAPGCGAVHGCSPRSPASIRAWNSGAESASTALSTARRRAFSSGVGGPKRRVVGASEEISVKESDRPLHWAKGRLE